MNLMCELTLVVQQHLGLLELVVLDPNSGLLVVEQLEPRLLLHLLHLHLHLLLLLLLLLLLQLLQMVRLCRWVKVSTGIGVSGGEPGPNFQMAGLGWVCL